MEDQPPKAGEPPTEEDLLPAIGDTENITALAILDKEKSELLWKMAAKFARSAIVPEIFQGKQDDCFIALQMAARMRVDPMMLMQSAFIIHGKLGFEAKFAVGLVNNSDLIVGRLKYEEAPEPGTDPFDNKYAVRAFATDQETGQEVYGEWITWTLVQAEGWDGKSGSKWKTMPGQMFHYRAATFFIRRHYPEVLMGMKTTDEILDAEVIMTKTDRTKALKDRLNGKEEDPSPAVSDAVTPAPEADPHPAEEQSEQGEPDGDEFDKYVKEKQRVLWDLCEAISGGKVVDTDKVLYELAGTIKIDAIRDEVLDKAIEAAENRLKEKEKPEGKGKKTGELFDQ